MLERLLRASTKPAGLSRRACAVSLMVEGVPGVEIARRIGYTGIQVSRVRRRFAGDGLDGPQNRPRSG